MRQQDVPIGAKVVINGKKYECTSKRGGARKFDCRGCDLYDNDDSCFAVTCIGDFRKDGQWVIYKEVKQ